MCKNDDPVVSAVKAPSTDEAMATAGVEHEPEIVKPPASIGWKEALKSGWVYEPKFQFYTREVLLGQTERQPTPDNVRLGYRRIQRERQTAMAIQRTADS